MQARTSYLRRGSALMLFAVATSIGASAQTQVSILVGDETLDYFGFSTASLGDVNGDGIPDFGVGGYRGSVLGLGRIKVYSGLDGALIHHILGPPGGSLGLVFAAGDVNGDGYDDFGGNHAVGFATGWLFSGLDGSTIATQTFARFFGGAGDINHDGHAEYVVRDGGLSGPHPLVSGASGETLGRLDVPEGYSFRGFVGDVNNDGAQDYAILGLSGPNSGSVEIRSELNDTLLLSLPPMSPSVGQIAGLGDIDQDGFNDIGIVRSNLATPARVDLVSSVDGHVLISLSNVSDLTVTKFLAGVPDADGDGHDDFVLASDPPRLHSGRTGAILAQFVREDGQSRPHSVDGVPDANGDGRPEIVVGSPIIFDPATSAGTAALFSYDGPAGTNYCVSLVNSSGQPAVITASGSTSLARNNLLLSVHGAPSGSLGLFLMSNGQQQTPLGSGVLCVGSTGNSIVRLPAASIDTNGHMLLELDSTDLPSGAGTISAGSTRNFQAWFRDPSPAGPVTNFSDAVTVTFTL